jgi:hypothetical protein
MPSGAGKTPYGPFIAKPILLCRDGIFAVKAVL